MDALHRLVLGLAIALAHIGGWSAARASSTPPTPSCACVQAYGVCDCTDCACKIRPNAPVEAPDRDRATVAPPTPRVPAPDRFGVEPCPDDARTHRRSVPAPDALPMWAGDDPLAFWCVWRT